MARSQPRSQSLFLSKEKALGTRLARSSQNLSDVRSETCAVDCTFFISGHSGMLVNARGNIDRLWQADCSNIHNYNQASHFSHEKKNKDAWWSLVTIFNNWIFPLDINFNSKSLFQFNSTHKLLLNKVFLVQLPIFHSTLFVFKSV